MLNLSSPSHGAIHSLVEAPDGRWLDAAGWVTPREVAKRYGLRRLTATQVPPELATGARLEESLWWSEDGHCFHDTELARVVSAIRALPQAPVSEPWFLEISGRPVAGADHPLAASIGAAPSGPSRP